MPPYWVRPLLKQWGRVFGHAADDSVRLRTIGLLKEAREATFPLVGSLLRKELVLAARSNFNRLGMHRHPCISLSGMSIQAGADLL